MNSNAPGALRSAVRARRLKVAKRLAPNEAANRPKGQKVADALRPPEDFRSDVALGQAVNRSYAEAGRTTADAKPLPNQSPIALHLLHRSIPHRSGAKAEASPTVEGEPRPEGNEDARRENLSATMRDLRPFSARVHRSDPELEGTHEWVIARALEVMNLWGSDSLAPATYPMLVAKHAMALGEPARMAEALSAIEAYLSVPMSGWSAAEVSDRQVVVQAALQLAATMKDHDAPRRLTKTLFEQTEACWQDLCAGRPVRIHGWSLRPTSLGTGAPPRELRRYWMTSMMLAAAETTFPDWKESLIIKARDLAAEKNSDLLEVDAVLQRWARQGNPLRRMLAAIIGGAP